MRRIRFTLSAALAGLLMASVAWAQDESADLRAALARYDALADLSLPAVSDRQLARLADGHTVILRERRPMTTASGEEQDKIRVVGLRRVPRPRLLVWLAALDISTAHSDRVTEHLIEVVDQGGSAWYQYLNTPWPVSDRHWVIENRKRVDLARASDGLIWEHAWRLADNGEQTARNLLRAGKVSGVSERDGERAIYLDVNRGAWTMLAVDDDTTLVAAHTAAVMGGWIPESWVARFVARQLGGVLDKLEERADGIHDRYTARYPVFTGDGVLITPDMAARERRLYVARATTGETEAPARR